jgi:hypothetical protein
VKSRKTARPPAVDDRKKDLDMVIGRRAVKAEQFVGLDYDLTLKTTQLAKFRVS